jgi:hypothetical protein
MSISIKQKCYVVETSPFLQYNFNNRTNQFSKPLKGVDGIYCAKPISFNGLFTINPTTILYQELNSLIKLLPGNVETPKREKGFLGKETPSPS